MAVNILDFLNNLHYILVSQYMISAALQWKVVK